MKRRACPSSPEVHGRCEEEGLSLSLRRSPRHCEEEGNGANPSSSEVPAVVVDEAAGLVGWRAFLLTSSGSAIKHTTTSDVNQPTLNNKETKNLSSSCLQNIPNCAIRDTVAEIVMRQSTVFGTFGVRLLTWPLSETGVSSPLFKHSTSKDTGPEAETVVV